MIPSLVKLLQHLGSKSRTLEIEDKLNLTLLINK